MFPIPVLVLFLIGGIQGQKSQCDVTAAKVALENQNTVVDTSVKRLLGTWFSQGCEIRPGPQFVLRSYTFKPDGSYKAVQHHYWDNSCSQPKFTMIAIGLIKLKRDSMLNPEAATGYVKHINITVTPQDNKAAKELEELVGRECPDRSWKSWRRHEEHLVYEDKDGSSDQKSRFRQNANVYISQQRPLEISGVLSCLGPLKWAFTELKLLKIQIRPDFKGLDFLDEDADSDNGSRYYTLELLLGDIHSRIEHREHYKPTSFQTPLLKHIRESDEVIKIGNRNYSIRNPCTICGQLSASNDKSPPHLLEQPHLPPYIWGEWVSTRCEVRPMGLYLTRKFSFYSEDPLWVGEHKFYEDPNCTVPKFLLTAAGHYMLTSSSNVITGTTNIDFKIEKATLKIYSKRMVQEMKMFSGCGRVDWQLDKFEDLDHGCLHLGILIPSIQYEIIKLEMNYEGACLLFLGQPDTDNMSRLNSERPTAFQDPLIKCGDMEMYTNGVVQNNPFSDEEYGYNAANERQPVFSILIVYTVVVIAFLFN